MKSLLIQTLETICPGNVYLQGTIAPEVNYPDKFITFWTNDSDYDDFYDDDAEATVWKYNVYFYTNNPAEISTFPPQIEAALKAVGFITQGRGHDLPSDVETHTGWIQEFIFKEQFDKLYYSKIAPYFYKAQIKNIDYKKGEEYFKKYKPVIGGCSAVSNGNIFGRNYDWTYDDRVSFVLYTPAINGRHAVMGVATAPNDLTKEFVDSKAISQSYKIVPFMLLDGINDAGLICEINVAPTGDKGITYGTNPDKEDLFAMMIPRYVLDYAATVDEAIALLNNRNVFCAYTEALKQEFHFMLADATKTVVIEFIDNEINVIEDFVDDKPILTNFYLSGYDGSRESLTDYAMGIERQAILTAGYGSANSETGMLNLLKAVKYTKAYSEDVKPLWYSEFCGDYGEPYGDLTKDSTPEEYAPVMNAARTLFNNRQRDGKTWQTVTASVYNRNERKLIVIPQESEETYTFNF